MLSRPGCGSLIALAFVVGCGGDSSGAGAPRFWAVGASQTTSAAVAVVARSDDGGFTWQEVFVGSRIGSASAVAFSDRENGWVLAGVAILHTTDGGDSFELQDGNVPLGDRPNTAVASIDADRAAVVGYVCRPSSALCLGQVAYAIHTTDGGAHWLPSDTTRIAQGPMSDVCFTPAGVGLAATSGGSSDAPIPKVALSLDGGASWDPVQQEAVAAYQVSCGGTGDLWALEPAERSRLWHSTDRGTTWTEVAEALAFSFFYLMDFVDGRNGWLVDRSENSPRMPALIHTRNGGSQWRVQPIPVDPAAGEVLLESAAFATERSGVVVGRQLKIESPDVRPLAFATKDGGSTWSEVRLPPGMFAQDVTGVP